jgi:lipopolysaccharide transport system ATP-binding protein
MGLRLGFAIAVAVDPEILIIDEVFAVGDMYFQKKCVDKIYDFKRRGKTILFCSHSLYDVRQLCDQAIWLRKGEQAAFGDSVFVTNEYTAFQRDHIGERGDVVGNSLPTVQTAIHSESTADTSRLPRILDARLYRQGTEEEVYQITTGDSLELRVWWQNPDPAEHKLNLGVLFMRQDMTTCGGMGTHLDGLALEGSGGCAVLELPNIQLLSGQLLVPVILLDGGGIHKYQEYLLPENLVIRTATKQVGMVLMEHRWRLGEQLPRPQPQAAGAAPKAG